MLWKFFIWEGDMATAGLEPCGMFSPTHLIFTVICLVAIFFAVTRSRGMTEKQLDNIVLRIAIVTTCLELGKIIFNWVNGGFTPNHWLPLTFCSFAIYSYWMIAFGNKEVHEMGKGYIVGGGIIAGLTFLVLPMTSVSTYPMFHYLSCYSMIFHSLMMYVGLSYLINGYYVFDLKIGYRKYLQFTLPACLLALTVNIVYGFFDSVQNCNMMFLSDPYRLVNILPFVKSVYDAAPFFYSLGVLAVYLTIPFFLPYGVCRLTKWTVDRKKAAEIPALELEHDPDLIEK